MQAVILTEYGQPENLKLKEIEKPTYNDDQVLIRIKAAGINPVDTKIRAGTSGLCKKITLPVILGFDVSGIVEAIGKNVKEFNIDDEVMGCIGFPGLGKAYAEYTTADPIHLTYKPSNVSFEEAAAVPLAGLTAYQTIYDHLQIQAGQRILIQAAAGGVGHLAVQFAKIAGAEVFGTASQKNIPFLKELGVDHPIDYKNSTFEDHVASLDAAMDAMGGEILYRTIKCIKRGGRVVCLPSSTKDDPVAIKLAKEQGVELIWPLMYPDQKQISQIAGFMRQGQLKVRVDEAFPLNQMAQAHRQVESHHTTGKVVVLI